MNKYKKLLSLLILSTLSSVFSMEDMDKQKNLQKMETNEEQTEHPLELFKGGCNTTLPEIKKLLLLKAKYQPSFDFKTQNVSSASNTKITQLAYMEYFTPDLVYDQNISGPCTANAFAFVIRYLSGINSLNLYNKADFFTNCNPYLLLISRLGLYWNTRWAEAYFTGEDTENRTSKNTGASIIGTVLAFDLYGAGPENIETTPAYDIQSYEIKLKKPSPFKGWPYNTDKLTERPNLEYQRWCFDHDLDGLNDGNPFSKDKEGNLYAAAQEALRYEDLTPLVMGPNISIRSKILNSLNKNRPVYMGINLDSRTFTPDKLGRIPRPDSNKLNSGHAMAIIGYGPFHKNGKNYYKTMNSYGLIRKQIYGENDLSKLGIQDDGCLYFDEDYIENIDVFKAEYVSVWFDQKIYKDRLAQFNQKK